MLQKAWMRYLLLFALVFPLYITINRLLFDMETGWAGALIFSVTVTIFWAMADRKILSGKEG
ncbi:hypothetical protein U0355_09765 [Salimicrobium sp. PL1-032A]|uniref:hypothetical protein n=1 Tax=Salimicrobium sp. PL1-032A TaxID=3095364 RepID=UPI00325FEB0D